METTTRETSTTPDTRDWRRHLEPAALVASGVLSAALIGIISRWLVAGTPSAGLDIAVVTAILAAGSSFYYLHRSRERRWSTRLAELLAGRKADEADWATKTARQAAAAVTQAIREELGRRPERPASPKRQPQRRPSGSQRGRRRPRIDPRDEAYMTDMSEVWRLAQEEIRGRGDTA